MSLVKDTNSVPHEIRPVPDPTVLTTQQLLREIGSSREIVETRFEGLDKAIGLLQATSDRHIERHSAMISDALILQAAFFEEKFRSVAVQFAERDTRTEQTSRDSRVAIDAALAAQVKSVDAQNVSNSVAISKSEAAFTKQIDLIGSRIEAGGRAIDGKIDDVKTRLNTLESHTNAFESRSTGKGEGTSQIGVIAMGIVATVATMISIATLLFNILHH